MCSAPAHLLDRFAADCNLPPLPVIAALELNNFLLQNITLLINLPASVFLLRDLLLQLVSLAAVLQRLVLHSCDIDVLYLQLDMSLVVIG